MIIMKTKLLTTLECVGLFGEKLHSYFKKNPKKQHQQKKPPSKAGGSRAAVSRPREYVVIGDSQERIGERFVVHLRRYAPRHRS